MAKATLFGQTAEFELVGSFDNDPYACGAFRYMTDVEQVCIDARELTPSLMRQFFGDEAPFAIHGSAPCQGSSKLLSTAKAKTAKYGMMNELALVHTRTILETWPGDLPAFILYENVPNITSRAAGVLTEIRKVLREAGYVLHDGSHECRHVGNLAQRRKRWFMIARNPAKIPAFLYLPPKKPGKVCADVLDELPMPNALAGGPMHALPGISALNWWRLWKIPAGGDWRDLLPDDGTPRRARFRRHHIEKWGEPSVTIGGSGSNGPCGIADPRGQSRFHHVDKVTDWNQPTVTHSPAPSSGAIAVADPRFPGSLGVLRTNEPSGAVTCKASPTTGRYSIADKLSKFNGSLGVLAWDGPSKTITGASGIPTTGPSSIADPRARGALDLEPQKGNTGRHYDKYAVRPWTKEALTVHGATRVGSGAPSIAQPLSAQGPTKGLRGRWGVLDRHGASGTVTGNARISTGSYNIAAPVPAAPLDLVPSEKCYDKGYAVIDGAREPSHTIAGNSFVGCGTYAITDDIPSAPLDLTLGCNPRAGAYGVLTEGEPSRTVIASACIDNSSAAIADSQLAPGFVVLSYEQAKLVADGHVTVPFAIVDRDHPEEPLAIVDDMAKPPYRWETSRSAAGKVIRKRVVVPLVLISEDGTWHRPLTTLELAVLQGCKWQHHGQPLDFGGGSTKQRELVGNMVPGPVGEAMGTQMLEASIASDSGAFFMYGGGQGIWVLPEHRTRLLRLGIRRVRPCDVDKLSSGEVAILDDHAKRIRHAPRRRGVVRWQDVARLLRLQKPHGKPRPTTPLRTAA